MKIRKGDTVKVIAGSYKDKGRIGKVLKVFPDKNRIIVEGVNLVKRHMRPTQKLPQGGIIEKEAPIHISNLMVVCPKCDQPFSRHGRVATLEGDHIACPGDYIIKGINNEFYPCKPDIFKKTYEEV